eukprot:scaffold363250_cov23-Prasinocladus_malaysianus.AAC.1
MLPPSSGKWPRPPRRKPVILGGDDFHTLYDRAMPIYNPPEAYSSVHWLIIGVCSQGNLQRATKNNRINAIIVGVWPWVGADPINRQHSTKTSHSCGTVARTHHRDTTSDASTEREAQADN